MDKIKFRRLSANEVDCRVSTVSEKGCSLLLYKDSRVDMNLLDETFGIFGWQRKHEVIDGNLYCTVSVKDPETGEWVSKQDVGTESYTEKEKGQASDSFKRACFNLGIGRELYTAPFIWVSTPNVKIADKNGKQTTYDTFKVSDIGYDENGVINRLVIDNVKQKIPSVYTYGKVESKEKPEPLKETAKKEPMITKGEIDELKNRCKADGIRETYLLESYKVKSIMDLTSANYQQIVRNWELIKSKENAHIS